MAMPFKPAPKLGVISIYRMKIHCIVAKRSYFFNLLLKCSPNIRTRYDIILLFVTQYMIRVIGNQITTASLQLVEISSGSECYCLKNAVLPKNDYVEHL